MFWKDKIDKPLARFTKEKKIKSNKKERDVITDTTEIQKIIRDYYRQLCDNKLDSTKEVDKFLKNTIYQDWLMMK